MSAYQPKTGARCTCQAGRQRDNCARCEGTGMVIDHAKVRRAVQESLAQKRAVLKLSGVMRVIPIEREEAS